MKLILSGQRKQMLKNWENHIDGHKPVVKLFDPAGAATWLLTEMKPEDNDIAFGLCDLGFGFPELGYVSLSELSRIRGGFGLGIERDKFFEAEHSLEVYAKAAHVHGGITFDPKALAQAKAALEVSA